MHFRGVRGVGFLSITHEDFGYGVIGYMSYSHIPGQAIRIEAMYGNGSAIKIDRVRQTRATATLSQVPLTPLQLAVLMENETEAELAIAEYAIDRSSTPSGRVLPIEFYRVIRNGYRRPIGFETANSLNFELGFTTDMSTFPAGALIVKKRHGRVESIVVLEEVNHMISEQWQGIRGGHEVIDARSKDLGEVRYPWSGRIPSRTELEGIKRRNDILRWGTPLAASLLVYGVYLYLTSRRKRVQV